MSKKRCTRCDKRKTINDFGNSSFTRDGKFHECKLCRNERRTIARREKRGHYATERDTYREAHNAACLARYYECKYRVFLHYGGPHPRCVCGFDDMRALTIDHINGGGNRHRKEIGQGVNFYKWLDRNLPSGFQVLCANCQQIKKVEERSYHQTPNGIPQLRKPFAQIT